MKTIFLTSFHVLISRNILMTPVLKMLTDAGVRVVILVPDYKEDYFRKTFGGNNIIIEGIKSYVFSRSFLGLAFKRMSRPILNTHTSKIRCLQKLKSEKKYFYYYFFMLPAKILGRFAWFRRFFRWADSHLAPLKGYFFGLFDKYHPDLVVVTDVNNENDVALLQDSKRRKIKTACIVRSWDNLTNFYMRAKPDKLIVSSRLLKEQAIELQGFDEKDVELVGIPHYDRYLNGPTELKELFFKKRGFDINKRLLLYVPVADFRVKENDVDSYMLEILSKLPVNILVRIPPAGVLSRENMITSPNIYFEQPGLPFRFKGDSEITKEDDDGLINSLYYADLVVTGPGTMNIDAAVVDRPMIMVNFYKKPKPYFESIIEYDYNHIQPILKSGGAKVVKSKEELLREIDVYLRNPKKDAEGRKKIIEDQCHELGGSSKRMADYILKILK